MTKSVRLQLEQFGEATIVDCHSFPQIPLIRALDQFPFRPDFNIGADTSHTPQKFIDLSVDFFDERGFSLKVDRPYSGSIVPMDYYHKNSKVQSIMLEINRKLYMNEPSNEKSTRYQEIKQVVQDFLRMIRNE